MTRFLKALFLILIFSTLSGCSDENSSALSSEVEISNSQASSSIAHVASDTSDFIANFTKEQAIEDYNYMWYMLEENFTAFDSIADANNLNLVEIREKHLARLNKITITYDTFYAIINDCLKEFRGLGHLRIVSEGEYFGVVEELKSILPSASEYERIRYEYLLQEQTKAGYEYLKEQREKKSIMSNKNPYINIPDKENLIFHKYENDIAYVKINSFAGGYMENDREALLSWYKENAETPYIIIDVSSNGGGWSRYWLNNIIVPNISKDLRYEKIVLSNDSSDTKEFLTDNGISPILSNELEGLNLKQEHEGKLVFKNYISAKPYYEEAILKGEIFVLIDSFSSSATDGFAGFCKSTGFASLVGVPTKGDGSGLGSPIYKPLPNSGLIIRYRFSEGLNIDGSSNIVQGTAPDIVSASCNSEAILETCLEHIRTLKAIGKND